MYYQVLQAGQLRSRITIQRPGPLDSFGQPSPEWLTEVTDVPAFIEPQSGLKTGPGAVWSPASTSAPGPGQTQLMPVETHRITIRYAEGLDATRRIVNEGRVFEILSVGDYQSRHAFMTLSCQERIGITDSGAPYGPPPLTTYTGAAGPRRYAITGTLNGVNTSFTLPGSPDPAVLVIVWNGQQMGPGSYTLGTLSGGITPVTAGFAPKSGDDFYAIF
jgi:head-tail adaptor